ncbi:MAG: SUMF1/EgtB/PvdO family nonheme iron enzyme [Anaerolineae bacterium]|nr:SUMF1/EgtB/PvdO family nonheme iron enzyme [Anaerolineae bacterium]
MSSLRRRTRDGSWQWLFIGVLLGVVFSAVVCLGSYAAGLLTFNVGPAAPSEATLADPTILMSEVAELPSPTPTREAQVIIVTATSSGMVVVQPTPTPLPPTPEPEEATEEPADEGAGAAAAAAPAGTPLMTPTVTPEEGAPDPILLTNATRMELVSGGDFLMGTNQSEVAAAVSECVNVYAGACDPSFAEDSFPPHNVILDSFQMEVNEVTVGQYVAYLNSLGPNSHLNGCGGQPCAATSAESESSIISFDGTLYSVADVVAGLPATHVTWYGAQSYCGAIERRLPTEAEWERAARGADSRVYPWGNQWAPELANTNRRDNTGERTSSGPVAVGTFPEGASPYGMLDMGGNVAEWVQDWYQANYYSQPEASGLNPQGPVGGTTKVVRGGSWDTVPFFARTMHRQEYDPLTQALFIGFRCVSDETPLSGAGTNNAGTGGILPSPTGVIAPTQDPNVTPTLLPSLPPGG